MPPVSLVKKVILHVCLCRCWGILVLPYWPSTHYLPLLVERGGVFKSFVADCLYVENGKAVFLHGGNKSSLFGSENFSTQCFFCCSTVLYGNRYSCYGVGGRLAARLLGRWTTGPVYDERTSFLPVHMNIVRFYATGCLYVSRFWLVGFFHYRGFLFSLNLLTRLLIIIFLFLLCLCFYKVCKVDVRLLRRLLI